MTKIIDNTNLGYLISKIKAAFWPKTDVVQIGLDNTPTANSDNLVKSGGVKTALDAKQNTLVSGTNIKTINNQSLLGSGNLSIEGGSGTSVKTYIFNYTTWTEITEGGISVPLATYEEMISDVQNGIPIVVRLQQHTTVNDVVESAQDIDFYLYEYIQSSVTGSHIAFFNTSIISDTILNFFALYRSGNNIYQSYWNASVQQKKLLKTSIVNPGSNYEYPSTSAVVNYVASAIPSTLDQVADGSTRKLSDYVPKSGGTLNNSATLTLPSTSTDNTVIGNGVMELQGGSGEVGVKLDGVSAAVCVSGESAIISSNTTQTKYKDGTIVKRRSNTDYTLTIPSKTGTLAVTTDIPSAVTESTVSGWGFSKTTGTVTGVKINGTTKTPTSGTVDLGTVLTSETSLSKGTTTGSGNAVTDISVSGHQITLTKGSTFLTSETSLSKGTTTGSGNAVTDISVSGHKITLTKGTTFLTSHQDISGKANLSGAAFTGAVTGTSSGNTAQFRNVTISSSEPTSSQGSNGDIWIVI